ncbi:hypothetical protein CWB99_01345 [Pseudoalteromonas rubra]|uniref:Dockerin domain-containing protein n=1 Tax=Pseudoalteromonas rubra TaxID=43658 RepID=A0A5S3WVU6_9GAMM|nr:dockerin type I domain-containing protein [Pseudoalteromonas rubra]TMP28104.1 hypothetical protein CWC00_22070 [Pseudoalteromonas rubra]TMP32768.1 hypothetical protein CWB99_01345 [Pseudoalteromonas rubra]
MKMVSKKATEKRATSAHPLSLGARIVRATLPVFLCSLPFLSQAQTPLKVGNEFLVNTHTDNDQLLRDITPLGNGTFIATWMSQEQDGDGSGVYAQRFNAQGQPVGSEFRVNSETTGDQITPKVAQLADGSLVFSWIQSESKSKLFARKFQEDGTPIGQAFEVYASPTEIYVGVSTTARFAGHSITAIDNGGFAIGWTDVFNGRSGISNKYYSYAKVFTADGTEVAQTDAVQDASAPHITNTNNGGFFMVWSGKIGGDNDGIGAQRFDASGATIGRAYRANGYALSIQSSAKSTQLSNGDFLITWQSAGRGIYAQRYDTTGVAQSSEFKVNTFSGGVQSSPSIAALDNGGYIISWQSTEQDGSEDGVYAQVFTADDTAHGAEFLVNNITQEKQVSPIIKATTSNDFVIGWSHKEPVGDYNIYAQRFQLEAVPVNAMALSLPPSPVLEGDILTLPLNVLGADVYGLDAVVSLSDTSKARISGGEYGEFLPSDERLSVPMGISDNQWDGALALMAPATAKSGEGDFAAVTLIAEQAGTVNLTLQAQMTDQQGNYLLQNSTDYAFTIAESVTLTGNISSLSTAGDYTFVTLLINGQPVTINPDGSFSVRVGLGNVTMALSAPGYLTAEKQVNLAAGQADIDFGQINLVGGDSNGDNQIDIADLTLLLGAYRSIEGQQNGYVMAADFNRDGAINLRDLTLLGANFGKQGPQSW